MHPFMKADILLPQGIDPEKWAVIACDQFASQPEYWQQVRSLTQDQPSTFHLILPESQLEGDCSQVILEINRTMRRYLSENFLQLQPDSFIYVERTLLNGAVRRGVVGQIDLESYDFDPAACAPIRATEETVRERIPPRMNIRRNAPLELPHVLLLCDDDQDILLSSLAEKKHTLPLLYSFRLMQGGGDLKGWLVAGEDAQAFTRQLAKYQQAMEQKYPHDRILYVVGDGNHSLASAKACYEENRANPLARYALVELENIHDDSQEFEPIHRIVKSTQPEALLAAMEQTIGKPEGAAVSWIIGNQKGTILVGDDRGTLPVAIVQNFLDDYLSQHPGVIDYIHGQQAVAELAAQDGCIGLILPPVEKSGFFQGILAGGTLPRKTFSMGHAQEKRYYMESRKIK